MIETWMKAHLVSDSNYSTVNLQCTISFLQGLAYNVDLHLMIVTLHMRFTIGIEQDNRNWWQWIQDLV